MKVITLFAFVSFAYAMVVPDNYPSSPPPPSDPSPPPPSSYPSPPPPPNTCMYNGKEYGLGPFKPSACEMCECHGFYISCKLAACSAVRCVDSKLDVNGCCKECPNGYNCKASDGKIIQEGDIYEPNEYTTCSCDRSSYIYKENAVCAMAMKQSVLK